MKCSLMGDGGRTCNCHACGLLIPVIAKVCLRCRATVRAHDVRYKGVRKHIRKGASPPTFQAVFCISGRVEFLAGGTERA